MSTLFAFCEIEKSYRGDTGEKGWVVRPDHAKPRWFKDMMSATAALLQYPEGWDLSEANPIHVFEEE